MKRISYYIISSLFFVGLLFGTSCNDDDFITEEPTTFYTIENSFNTVSQVEASVTNIYVHVKYWFQNDFFGKGIGADMFDTPYWRCSGNGYSNYSAWSSEYWKVAQVWDAYYQLVSYANQTIEGADSENIIWESEDDYDYVIAQSKFFRGFAYLTLGEMFGGVPIVTQFYTTPKYDFVRSTRVETYQQAITDLEDAVEKMPDYPTEAGRVAKGVAYHYLSEAYLALATIQDNNVDNLNQSIKYASMAMELHSLMTERFGSRALGTSAGAMNGVAAYYADGDVFFDLFQRGNLDYSEGNTEALWTLQNDYLVAKDFGGNNGLSYPREFSPVLRNANWKAEYKENNSSPWPSMITAYVGGRGVSGVAPTEMAYNTVWEGAYSEDIRNNNVNMRRTFVCMDETSSYYGQVVTEDMLDPNTLENIYPISCKLAPIDDWGYEDLEDGGNRSSIYRDEYATRLSETYLLRAEAYYRLGESDKAAADINVIRTRAQCAYLVSAGDVSIDFILDERARELYGEERRWCTLLRMGGTVAVDRIAKYGYFSGSESSFFQGANAQPKGWNLFPIPQTVIDANLEAELEQNEGWN